jgi:hypothetical protein
MSQTVVTTSMENIQHSPLDRPYSCARLSLFFFFYILFAYFFFPSLSFYSHSFLHLFFSSDIYMLVEKFHVMHETLLLFFLTTHETHVVLRSRSLYNYGFIYSNLLGVLFLSTKFHKLISVFY